MDWTDRTLYPNSGPNGPCRKCGYKASLSGFLRARYCSGAIKKIRGWWATRCEYSCKMQVAGEHMHRHCILCEAEWVEACVEGGPLEVAIVPTAAGLRAIIRIREEIDRANR